MALKHPSNFYFNVVCAAHRMTVQLVQFVEPNLRALSVFFTRCQFTIMIRRTALCHYQGIFVANVTLLYGPLHGK